MTTIKVFDANGRRIALGKRASYEAKTRSGTGVVFAIESKATGTWVTVNDADNRRYVTVRPSQVVMR